MKQALQIAIDYMNDRLEDHDCKYQRHPATEAERINILADIETVKEALAKQEGQSNFCPQCEALARKLKAAKQEQGEPVANASTWFALVMNAAAELENASIFLRDEDAKRAAISGAKYYRDQANTLYTTQQQRKPLTDEQLIDLWPSLIMHQHTYAFARAIEAAHGIEE